MTEYCLKEKRDVILRVANYTNGYVDITIKTNDKKILDYYSSLLSDEYFINVREDLKRVY